MTARSEYTIRLPYPAPNLNDLNDDQRTAAYRRGRHDEHLALVGVRKRTRRGRVPRKGPHDQYAAVKGQWAVRVLAHSREQRVPTGAFPHGAHVHIHIVEANARRDPDNITSGAAKLVLDGLVKAEILPTDGWRGVRGLSFSWSVGAPAVIVTLSQPKE